MPNILENAAEIADFFRQNETILISRYKNLSKNSKNDMQRKSCAYSIAQEFLLESLQKVTPCQVNKLTELIIFKSLEE